jgi:HEAT repeat protein
MIDNLDASVSLLRVLVAEGLKCWSSEALIEVVQDKSVIVRTAAARELHMRSDIDTIFEKMVVLTSNGNAYVREIAAFVLGQLGSPAMLKRGDSYPYLVKLLSDEDEDVRAAAAAGIGHLSFKKMPPVAEDGLIALSGDRSKKVRAAVAFALGNSSGKEEVLAALKSLLRDRYSKPYAELGMDMLSKSSGAKLKKLGRN